MIGSALTLMVIEVVPRLSPLMAIISPLFTLSNDMVPLLVMLFTVPFRLAEILLRPGFVPVIVTVRTAVCGAAATASLALDLGGGGAAAAFFNWLTMVLWRAAWRSVVWSGVRGVRRRSMTILFLLIVVNFSKGRKSGLNDVGCFHPLWAAT